MTSIQYIQSYQNYFWVWEEDGEVIAINGGSTIAYTDEVVKILEVIAERGLPSFDAVLLAIIAINSTQDDDLNFVFDLFLKLDIKAQLIDDYLNESFKFLRLLQSLPKEFKTGKKRHLLLQTIFENAHNKINVSTSKGIVMFLKENKEKNRSANESVLTSNIFHKNIRALQILSQQFKDCQSIIDAIGNLPEIADELVPEFEIRSFSEVNYNDFIEELIDKPQTYQIGTLIKPIWAGFNIPIFNANPSEQPLGGVSDLSNKGDFDKLLVSEFANDDFIFMSRLANNEALYLHREMPPVKDNLKRIMLIDISLKTWGTPKILSFATSLAISKHPKSKSESELFLVGDDFHAVAYDNTGNIIEALQKVALSLNASKGIAQFLEFKKERKHLEIFYITTTDGHKNTEINKLITENSNIFKYIITASIEGNIQFYSNKNKVLKHLQTINLPLEKLWKLPKNKYFTENSIELPLIHSIPLLFPLPGKIHKIITFENEVYFIANKCLYRNKSDKINKNGFELILQNVPLNGKYALGKSLNGKLFFLSYDLQIKEIIITELTSFLHASCYFNEWKSNQQYKDFLFINDQFTFLIKNPDAFIFMPNFNTNSIEIIKEQLNSGIFSIDYINRQKEINDFEINFKKPQSFNVLKNVHEIYINEFNLLTINNHTLNRSELGQYFNYLHYNKIGKKQIAKSKYNNIKKSFYFNDGSEVKVLKEGCFVLKSSDKSIPTIYIPSTIDNSFGIATETSFAGNEFFYKIPFITFYIHAINSEMLNAIKIIKKYSDLGMKHVKQLVDNVPSQFSFYCQIKNADLMIEELQNIGCKIEYATNTKEQIVISTDVFYDNYIQEFINKILLQ